MRFLSILVFLLGIGLGNRALAEGGYYSGILGARASGRAGAFTAAADDATAVSYNPAGLAKVDGTLVHIGNAFSYNVSIIVGDGGGFVAATGIERDQVLVVDVSPLYSHSHR